MAKWKGIGKMRRRKLMENGNNEHATWMVGTPR